MLLSRRNGSPQLLQVVILSVGGAASWVASMIYGSMCTPKQCWLTWQQEAKNGLQGFSTQVNYSCCFQMSSVIANNYNWSLFLSASGWSWSAVQTEYRILAVDYFSRFPEKSTDPHLFHLVYRSTPLSWWNYSLAELLMRRRIHYFLQFQPQHNIF